MVSFELYGEVKEELQYQPQKIFVKCSLAQQIHLN